MLIYTVADDGTPRETGRLDLPKELSLHEFRGDTHPFFALDLIITASCGQGFVHRLRDRGVRVIATSETDPVRAATQAAAGQVLPGGTS